MSLGHCVRLLAHYMQTHPVYTTPEGGTPGQYVGRTNEQVSDIDRLCNDIDNEALRQAAEHLKPWLVGVVEDAVRKELARCTTSSPS